MNLHEYQAKEILKTYGLPVPKGFVIEDLAEIDQMFTRVTTEKAVVKAQIHAGGRGKAGGVRLVDSQHALTEVATELLHKPLVTYQTDAQGQMVNHLLIEETCAIAQELYLGAVLDRTAKRVVFMASTEGGVEIEKVAAETPDKILKVVVDPYLGILPFQGRQVAFQLGLTDQQRKQFTQVITGLSKLFFEHDLSLLEINPLVITAEGDLICLDCKLTIDDNALYRQPHLEQMRDPAQEDPRELAAQKWELNYIALDGNIGCMVNGAGLAMATMDLIKLHGGTPANFLDVGGGATQERVREAFKIILSDEKVKGILVNIFGGIVRCDLIAEGIINAVAEVDIKIPVVVRLEGNRAAEATTMLAESGLNVIAATSLAGAAQQIVKAVGEKK